MKKIEKGCLLAVGMVCVLAMGGCQGSPASSGKTEEKPTAAAEATEPVTQAPVWGEDEDTELYNDYVDVYNHMTGRMTDSLGRYFEYVDFTEEFSLLDPESGFFSCHSIADNQIEKVEDTYSLVQEKPEPDAVDKAFVDMYPSMIQIFGCLNDIYEYADEKSYETDDYAKAKEYHATLWAALNEYLEKAGVFEEELTAVVDQQSEDSLKQLKEEGFETLYEINVMLNNAQALQMEFAQEEVYDDNITDMDLEKIRPLRDAFVESVDTILEMSKNESKLVEEGVPINSAYWHTFLSNMEGTRDSLTKVMEKAEAGTPLTQSDTMISFPGNCSLASFDNGISSMISDYNNFIN